MTSQQLLDPIIEGGIHSTNFFNGRRLTAEDLLREKKANRQHEQFLGQAIGEGVVYGLEVGLPNGLVTGGSTLEIQKGLAINRNGDALYLPNTIPLSLVPPPEEDKIIKDHFTDCKLIHPLKYPSNIGIYVLLIKPATDLSGSAPMSSIPDDGSIIGCGKSDLVEGVQFRTVKMDLNGPAFEGLNSGTKDKLLVVSDKTDNASVSMFRNIVAHACFGTEEKAKFIADPFGSNDSSNCRAIDKLRSLDDDSPYKITDCDVPLAIFHWTKEKIKFVDMWSVHRRPYELTLSATWPTLISPHRQAEAEASFYQFQDQVESLTRPTILQTSLSSIEVQEYFRYLPAAGFIPITGLRDARGFDYIRFFSDDAYRDSHLRIFSDRTYRNPVFIEGARLQPLLHESIDYPPIDLTGKVMLWLYLVRENIEDVGKAQLSPPQSYMVFTTGQMPFRGEARYDVSRWNYANYV